MLDLDDARGTGGAGASATDGAVVEGGVLDAATPTFDGASVSPGTYAEVVRADDPFVFWSFDEETGPFVDHVRKLQLVQVGTVERGPGIVGGAAILPPGAGSLRVPDGVGLFDFDHESAFAIELWLRSTTPTASLQTFLLRRTQNNSAFNGFIAYVREQGETPFARFETWRAQNDAGKLAAFVEAPIADRLAFTHIVFSYEPGDVIRTYVDGAPNGGSSRTPVVNEGPNAMPGQPLLVADSLQGAIDELAFYRHALAPSRVKAHYDLATVGK